MTLAPGMQAAFDVLNATVARLTAERDQLLDRAGEAETERDEALEERDAALAARDALQQQVQALQADNQIKDAAVEGAIRRAERAEAELQILKDEMDDLGYRSHTS